MRVSDSLARSRSCKTLKLTVILNTVCLPSPTNSGQWPRDIRAAAQAVGRKDTEMTPKPRT